jgi:hypothetical protein
MCLGIAHHKKRGSPCYFLQQGRNFMLHTFLTKIIVEWALQQKLTVEYQMLRAEELTSPCASGLRT